jgi:hypothetical protein
MSSWILKQKGYKSKPKVVNSGVEYDNYLVKQ